MYAFNLDILIKSCFYYSILVNILRFDVEAFLAGSRLVVLQLVLLRDHNLEGWSGERRKAAGAGRRKRQGRTVIHAEQGDAAPAAVELLRVVADPARGHVQQRNLGGPREHRLRSVCRHQTAR